MISAGHATANHLHTTNITHPWVSKISASHHSLRAGLGLTLNGFADALGAAEADAVGALAALDLCEGEALDAVLAALIAVADTTGVGDYHGALGGYVGVALGNQLRRVSTMRSCSPLFVALITVGCASEIQPVSAQRPVEASATASASIAPAQSTPNTSGIGSSGLSQSNPASSSPLPIDSSTPATSSKPTLPSVADTKPRPSPESRGFRWVGRRRGPGPSTDDLSVLMKGDMPLEIIGRIVRQNFGRLRMCYEAGLKRDPNLSGRVAVEFVIDRDGSVTSAVDGGSDLPDQEVVRCIANAYRQLTFPAPPKGPVELIYPFVFSPGA